MLRSQRFQLPILLPGLTVSLLLGLVLAASSAAQPTADRDTKATTTYKVSPVFGARLRSAVAATGADIFEVGHDYILVEATAEEARAILGLPMGLLRRQQRHRVERDLPRRPLLGPRDRRGAGLRRQPRCGWGAADHRPPRHPHLR